MVHRDPSLALLHVEFRLHALRDPKFRRQLAQLHREQVARDIHGSSPSVALVRYPPAVNRS